MFIASVIPGVSAPIGAQYEARIDISLLRSDASSGENEGYKHFAHQERRSVEYVITVSTGSLESRETVENCPGKNRPRLTPGGSPVCMITITRRKVRTRTLRRAFAFLYFRYY